MSNRTKIFSRPKTTTTTSTFLPTSITGSQLWLDGADPAGNGVIPANGAAVSIWVDKSGNGRNGTQVNNPTYNLSRKALYFTGTEYYNLPDSTFPSGNSSYTYFMIVNFTSYGTGYPYPGVLGGGGFSGSDSIGFRTNGAGGGFYAYWFGNDIYSSTTYNINEVVSIVSFFNSPTSSRSLIQNFTTTTTAGGGRNQPAINNTVGKAYGSEYMFGYIHEVIVYNTALSTNDRQTVEGYLAQKWGLSSFLAAGHPGLTTPIYQTVTSVLAPTTAVVSATFIPTSIGGCGIWLDSTDITSFTYSSASNISQWRDKSGFSNHFNTSSGTPTSILDNSRSVVNFPSGAIMSSASQISFLTSSAFFIVSKLTGVVDWGNMLLGFTNINGGDFSIRFYNYVLLGTTAQTEGGGSMGTSNYYVNGSFNPSFGSNVYFNQYSIIDTVSPFTNATSSLTLSSAFMNRNFVGNIAEFIYYPAGVTSNQRQTIEGYLAQKWGLTASMPAGHPALTNVLYGTTTINLPKQKVASLPKLMIITSTFLPNSISGCQLWLDSMDLTSFTYSSGSNISQWRDKSGSSNHFTPSSGTPTSISDNGRAVVNFTSGVIMTSANQITFTTSSAFFIVSKITGVVSWGNMLLGFTNINGSDFSIRFFEYILNGTVQSDVGSLGNGNYYVNGSFNPSFGNNVYFNKYSIIDTVTPSTSGTSFLTLSSAFMSRNFVGNIAEFLYYPGGVTSNQRQTIEGYLAQKWGLTSSMPAGHTALTTSLYGSVTIIAPTTITTTFLPTSISGCQLWLDAADTSTISPSAGGTLTAWTDKSGTNKTIVVNSGPTYVTTGFNGSYPYMNFTAGNYLTLTVPSIGTGDIAIFAVWRQTTSTQQHNVFSIGVPAGGTETAVGWNNGENRYKFYRYAGPQSVNSSATNNANVIGSAIQVSGVKSLFINGNTPDSTGTESHNQTNTTAYIGNSSSFRLFGELAELIFYIGTLTTTQRQTIESYLAQKWGLTSSLVAGHPGKTTSVYQLTVPLPRQKIRLIPVTVPLASYTQTFSYTGTNQTFVVPATTTSITVYMWGAGGAGNTNYGGAAAMVQGVFTTTPGETLNILVGQGGTINGSTTFGGGGAGGGNMTSSAVGIGYSGNGFPNNGGSGGGRSAIQRGGTDPTNDIVVAGGGGGGSYFSSDYGGSATFSGTANPGAGGLPGLGGTQSAGGAGGGTGQYGQGLGGSRGIGGNTYNNNIYNGGGGGGGGYYGGGAGGTNGGDGAGGGGGSSLTSALSLISGQSVLGFNSTNGYTAPNNTSPYYVSGVGNGAPSISSNPRAGGNGLIVLVYMA